MSEIVEFKPVNPVSVTLEDPPPATRLQVTLGARSTVSRDMFVRVSVSAQDREQSGWFTVPLELGRVALKAGQELTIPVTVDIPARTPFDKHGFKVLVADDATPETDFSESPPVTVERKQKVKDNSWWKWVAVGVAGAGVMAIAIILLVNRDPGLGDKCNPSRSNCPAGAACPSELQRCVAKRGDPCKGDDQCVSKKCVNGTCTGVPVGELCYSIAGACEGDGHVQCLTPTGRCASYHDGPCRTAADCVEGACTKVHDALKCGDSIGQLGCTADPQCPPTQVCVPTTAGKACLYRGGQTCPALEGTGRGGQFFCASQICNIHGKCAPEDKSCVPADQDCGPGENCVNDRCVAVDGGPARHLMLDYAANSALFLQLNSRLSATATAKARPSIAIPVPKR